ncbi:MAG: hypothetical protein ACQESR_06425 [Planctomycetota bacterium]
MDGDAPGFLTSEGGESYDGHNLGEPKFRDLPTITHRQAWHVDPSHGRMLETTMLNAQEYLLDKFFGRMFWSDGFTAVIEIEASVPNYFEGLLSLFGIKVGIRALSKSADMVCSMDASLFQLLGLSDTEVPDVHDDLGLPRNSSSDLFGDREQIVQGVFMHRHQKNGVEVARYRKRKGSCDDFFRRQASSLESGILFAEHAELTISGARSRLDSDLSQKYRLIAKSTPRHLVGHGHHRSGFQRLGREAK